MALADNINALPDTIADGNTGHTGNHQTIHAALKNHSGRLTDMEGRVPSNLALALDTTVGTRIMAGSTRIYGETGLINITHLLDPQPNSGRLSIKRINNEIYFSFEHLRYSAGVVPTAQLPVGWRPQQNYSSQLTNTLGNVCGRLLVTPSGAFKYWADNSDTGPSTTVAAPTTAEWPTTLTIGA